MTITVDLGALKESRPHLWRQVVGIYNKIGVEEIAPDTLKPEVAEELRLWLETPPSPPKRDEPEEFRIDPTEAENRDRARKAEADEQGAKKRLEYYESQGLEPSDHNGKAIVEWVKNHPQLRGYFSATAVELAVQWL